MRKLAWLTCTTLALTLGACGDDGGGDENNSTDPSSSSGPTTNDPTVTTSMSTSMSTSMTTEDPSSGTDPTDASTGPEPTGSSGPDPDSSSGSGSESGTGGDVCAADVEDDACTTCTKGMCCDELTECYADADCQCVVLCSQALIAKNPGLDPTMAAGMCTMPSKGGDPAECTFPANALLVINLSQCVTGMCGDDCGPDKG